ncbi:MAG: 3-methylornithyl-N6-L-lysine dehydrogenase PylD [Eubacteriales bacterium]|nr:3-methylornithyl-N6-L-lysine dehydrogenase PylD [Eubacteriales bacterium]
MTRLISDWIQDMETTAAEWDGRIKEITGKGYIELAAECSGHSVKRIQNAAASLKVAAVPITSGLGVISSFAESVAAIVSAMGFETFVTERTDVDGFFEAHVKGADICFMADDDRYIALNINNGHLGENNISTVKGYRYLLESVAGGLDGKAVAVVGYGIIGQLMADELALKGASVTVFEQDNDRLTKAAEAGFGTCDDNKSLSAFSYIAECTNTGKWMDAAGLKEDVFIAAPGIPLSLNQKSAEVLEGRYIHDMLEIGTVVMLGYAI